MTVEKIAIPRNEIIDEEVYRLAQIVARRIKNNGLESRREGDIFREVLQEEGYDPNLASQIFEKFRDTECRKSLIHMILAQKRAMEEIKRRVNAIDTTEVIGEPIAPRKIIRKGLPNPAQQVFDEKAIEEKTNTGNDPLFNY